MQKLKTRFDLLWSSSVKYTQTKSCNCSTEKHCITNSLFLCGTFVSPNLHYQLRSVTRDFFNAHTFLKTILIKRVLITLSNTRQPSILIERNYIRKVIL